MFGPDDRPVESQLAPQLRLERDDLLAIDDVQLADHVLLDDRQARPQSEALRFAGLLRAHEVKRLCMRFAMPLQPGAFFGGRHRSQSIGTDEVPDTAAERVGGPPLAGKPHRGPEGAQPLPSPLYPPPDQLPP